MNFPCDRCGKPATIHLTEIMEGQKLEKHLCENCAVADGIAVKANVPLKQLLEDFILQTSDQQEASDLNCNVCGKTFADFREHGTLGCQNDYDAFRNAMEPLLERAHGGATQHIGKVPARSGGDQKKQNLLLRLRAELKGAVAAEDYEQAAALRDKIKELEES